MHRRDHTHLRRVWHRVGCGVHHPVAARGARLHGAAHGRRAPERRNQPPQGVCVGGGKPGAARCLAWARLGPACTLARSGRPGTCSAQKGVCGANSGRCAQELITAENIDQLLRKHQVICSGLCRPRDATSVPADGLPAHWMRNLAAMPAGVHTSRPHDCRPGLQHLARRRGGAGGRVATQVLGVWPRVPAAPIEESVPAVPHARCRPLHHNHDRSQVSVYRVQQGLPSAPVVRRSLPPHHGVDRECVERRNAQLVTVATGGGFGRTAPVAWSRAAAACLRRATWAATLARQRWPRTASRVSGRGCGRSAPRLVATRSRAVQVPPSAGSPAPRASGAHGYRLVAVDQLGVNLFFVHASALGVLWAPELHPPTSQVR